MAKTIEALYQDGVFKPLTKVRLMHRQRVKLTVTPSKKRPEQPAKPVAHRRRVSLGEVSAHPAYRIVGLFKSGVHDLSQNHDTYLYS